MSFHFPEKGEFDPSVRDAAFRILKEKGYRGEETKTDRGHTIRFIQGKGKKLSNQDAVNILANRVAELKRRLDVISYREKGAEFEDIEPESKEALEGELKEAEKAHTLLAGRKFDRHTWVDRTKQGAALAIGGAAFAYVALFKEIFYGAQLAISLLNRGLMMAADKAVIYAEAQKGEKGDLEKEIKLQAVKAYDNLRWGILTKKGRPDYLKAVDTLYKRQSFLSELKRQDASFKPFLGPANQLHTLWEKKIEDYILQDVPPKISEKEAKKLGISKEEIPEWNAFLEKGIKEIDKAFQTFEVDVKREKIFKDQLLHLMSRRNNFLKFILTGGFRLAPELTPTKRDDALFTPTSYASSVQYQFQKAFQSTSQRVLKEMLASSTDQATAIIQLVEKPGFVKRISHGLLNAVQNSPMNAQSKVLILQALFENSPTDRGREKILTRIHPQLAAEWINTQFDKATTEAERQHLTLLALQVGDPELIKKTANIDLATVTADSLKDHPLISDPQFKNSEGQNGLFFAMKGQNRRLMAALADALSDKTSANAYLMTDSRGFRPVHYMNREDAVWLDNHYIGADGKTLDGTKPGSFSALMDRLEALRFEATAGRVAAGAFLGKMIGSAGSTAVILAAPTPLPGETAFSTVASAPIESKIVSAIETNGPVYAGLISGAFLTFPIQKLTNNLYVWFNNLHLSLSQYETEKRRFEPEVAVDALRDVQLPAHVTKGAWSSTLQTKDAAKIAALILKEEDSEKATILSRDQLRMLSDIRYFPQLQHEGKMVDTQELISHYFLQQADKKESPLKAADIQEYYENLMNVTGQESVKKSIEDWAKEMAPTAPKTGKDPFFQSTHYRASLAVAVKMGDVSLLRALRTLDQNIKLDTDKPRFFTYMDKEGETLYHLAALSKNARMILEVEEMMYLGRADIESDEKYEIQRGKQHPFYVLHGGLEIAPNAFIAMIRGSRTASWNITDLRNGKGQRMQDVIAPEVAAEYDALKRMTPGSAQTISQIAEEREGRFAKKALMTGLSLPSTKLLLYEAVATAIDSAVLSAGIAGFQVGGPAVAFLAAYTTHLTAGVAILGATAIMAAAIGSGAEKSIGALENVMRGYDNAVGTAYGQNAEEMFTALKESQRLANVDPAIAKASEEAAKRVLGTSLKEALKSLGEEEALEQATLNRLAKFGEIADKILATHQNMQNTTKLLLEAAYNLHLTPIQTQKLSEKLTERLGVYSGQVAKQLITTPTPSWPATVGQVALTTQIVGGYTI